MSSTTFHLMTNILQIHLLNKHRLKMQAVFSRLQIFLIVFCYAFCNVSVHLLVGESGVKVKGTPKLQ